MWGQRVFRVQVHGSEARAEKVWDQLDDGREISIVWPAGFTARFEPELVLRNERGATVAQEGGTIELDRPQGAPDYAGTAADPFFASGVFLGGCYPLWSAYPPAT